MIKRIFILGIIFSLIQTFVYFIFVELLQFAETKFVAENYRQITEKILPYIVLIFFESVLIQNILSSIINKKLFTWIMFSLSTIFLLVPFFKTFAIWPSLPFILIITLLLLSYQIVAKNYNKKIESIS
ncbi:VIT1/CCC1 family predicted Fe2+/Mn2+ transporter [Flavobacterium sp. 2755]|nr:VIT1/CCC1 family predicted Fe2+/Mn2+ transporter [Flavobacterium sp. 2755]